MKPYAIVTIASDEYRPQWRVLAESVKKFAPHATFLTEKFTGMPAQRHDVVKMALVDHERVMFLGADTELFTFPLEVLSILDLYDFAAVPHLCRPLTADDEIRCYQAGFLNADFQLWRRSPHSDRMLRWYLDHLLEARPGINDQHWISQLPLFFGEAAILRKRTWNVAYWNAQAYNFGGSPGQYWTDGGNLGMFHYSGFDGRPERMSKYYTGPDVTGALLELHQEYARKLNHARQAT